MSILPAAEYIYFNYAFQNWRNRMYLEPTVRHTWVNTPVITWPPISPEGYSGQRAAVAFGLLGSVSIQNKYPVVPEKSDYFISKL